MHPAEMTDHRAGYSQRSPEALREYLADTAQRELDELRAEFDVRLAALEIALSRRDSRQSLEHVVLDLARAATAEAEAAAQRASLEAQIQVEAQAAAAAAQTQRALEAERASSAAMREELERLGARLESEHESIVQLRHDLQASKTSLDQARATLDQE